MSSAKTAAIDVPAISSRRTMILVFSCLLLLAQALPLMSVRWVADESWYASSADSLARHGELKAQTFPENALQGRVQTMSPVYMVPLAAVFKLFGTSLYTAKILPLLSGLCGILLTYLLGCELESR